MPPSPAVFFKISEYRADRRCEVEDIEEALLRISDFIKASGTKIVLLPGIEALPLKSALELLTPEVEIVFDPALRGLKTQAQTNALIQANPDILRLTRAKDRRVLCFDDATDTGKTHHLLKTALAKLDLHVTTASLFLVNGGRMIRPEYGNADYYGITVPRAHAPSWYFKMRDPEAYDCGGCETAEEVVAQAALELKAIASRINSI